MPKSNDARREAFRQTVIAIANKRMEQYDVSPTDEMKRDLIAQQEKELRLLSGALGIVKQISEFAENCRTGIS